MIWNTGVETSQGTSYVTTWRSVQFVGDRFFAMGGTDLGISTDGEPWNHVALTNVQPSGVAYGKGRYVLVGSGPIQVSDDGVSFRQVVLDCALPSACIRDPSGGEHQGYHAGVLFQDGRFYTSQLISTDGIVWQANPNDPPGVPVNGGYFRAHEGQLQIWSGARAWDEMPVIRPAKVAQTATGRDPRSVGVLPSPAPLPESVSVAFEDGLDCRSASCVLLGGNLYLAPPPGTAALPDHVARTDEGSPLLSDDCPVSTMIACDDYAQRRGCHCRADAPRTPSACDDVSNFQCAARFSPRPGEWELPEIGDAGCSCDAVDPNQPATLGTDCAKDASVCAPPMRCLPVDAPATFGPPLQRPQICTAPCTMDRDCPSWQASGFCAGPVTLRCSASSCQPRDCH